ncbi:MAG: hypothetical protein ACOCTI_01680, partial [Phycisphaeraceae bacterium]
MTRDHLVQIVALTLVAVFLAGATLLSPVVGQQRRDLDLVHEVEFAEGTPLKYTLAAAALGSLRGVAVDVLWYRADQLQNQGKFYEANSLAEFITTLQPRFPQVWVFQAWNMAYNISVATQTPQERWDWVNKGINLLRDEGVAYNPEAIALYRQVGWILFHKVGQRTDDMHWHYKARFARRWHEMLGAPAEGATSEQAAAAFAPIAEAADRYWDRDRLAHDTRETLDSLAAEHADWAPRFDAVRGMPLAQAAAGLAELERDLEQAGRSGLAHQVAALTQAARERVQRVKRSSLSLLLEEQPDVRPLVEAMRGQGFELNQQTLRRLGQLQMTRRYLGEERMLRFANMENSPIRSAVPLLELLQQYEDQPALETLLAYLRAKVLVNDYHMDPQFMRELMTRFGPLDWRHPISHSAYWGALGVEKSELYDRRQDEIDLLNTDRLVIHSMQELIKNGRLIHNPFGLREEMRVDLLPDPRFIKAYEEAMLAAIERAEETGRANFGTLQNFYMGHENLLIEAVVSHYLYGDLEEAERYYRKAREQYGRSQANVEQGTYERPLSEFVLDEMQGNFTTVTGARKFID